MMGLIMNIFILVMSMFSLREGELREWFTFTAKSVDNAFGRPTPTITVCFEHIREGLGVIRAAFPDTEVTRHSLKAEAVTNPCFVCEAVSNGKHTPEAAAEVRQYFVEKLTAQQSAEAAQVKAEEERVLSPEVKEEAQALVNNKEVNKMTRIYSFREVYKPKAPTHVEAKREDGTWVEYDKPAGYAKGALLMAAGRGAGYEVRTYKPTEHNLSACFEDARGATLVKPTDSGFAAIWIYNHDGSVRECGNDPDIAPFKFRMSAKWAKRISLFMTDAWLWGQFLEHEVDIEYREVGESTDFDGNVFISHSFREKLIKKMVARIPDKDEAKRLAKEMRKEEIFSIRMVTVNGLIKGHATLAKTGGPDVVVHTPDNFKKEVFLEMPMVYVHLVPESQYKDVFTDRQALSIGGHELFMVPTPGRTDSLGLVKDAMVDYIDRLISKLRRGIPIDFDREGVEDDELASMKRRRDAFYHATGSLNESIYHLQMMADSVVRSLTPRELFSDDKDRRLPVPFAQRISLRTEASYEFAARETLGAWDSDAATRGGLEGNVVAFTPLGFVFSREVQDDVLYALGGADLDDKAAVHIRIAVGDDEFFGINDGDVIAVILRPPSASSENAHEFWMSKVSLDANVSRKTFLKMLKSFGINSVKEAKAKLPRYNMAERPVNIVEVGLSDGDIEWVDNVPPAVYDKQYVAQLIADIVEYRAVYGTHSNIVMACAEAGIEVPFHALEEDWVDHAQQTPFGPNFELMDEANNSDKKFLVDSGIALEKWHARRLNFIDKDTGEFTVPVRDGIISELIDFHIEQVDRYAEAARDHIRKVAEIHEIRAEGYPVELIETVELNDSMTKLKQFGEQPRLLAKLLGKVKAYARHNRISIGDFTSNEVWMDEATDRVYDAMMDAAPERADNYIMESFYYAYMALQERNTTSSIDVRVFSYGDHHLMFGKVFTHLLELLRARGSVAEDWNAWANNEE